MGDCKLCGGSYPDPAIWTVQLCGMCYNDGDILARIERLVVERETVAKIVIWVRRYPHILDHTEIADAIERGDWKSRGVAK